MKFDAEPPNCKDAEKIIKLFGFASLLLCVKVCSSKQSIPTAMIDNELYRQMKEYGIYGEKYELE